MDETHSFFTGKDYFWCNSREEKQILLESLDINIRKEKMEQILNNYIKDEFENTTIQ